MDTQSEQTFGVHGLPVRGGARAGEILRFRGTGSIRILIAGGRHDGRLVARTVGRTIHSRMTMTIPSDVSVCGRGGNRRRAW